MSIIYLFIRGGGVLGGEIKVTRAVEKFNVKITDATFAVAQGDYVQYSKSCVIVQSTFETTHHLERLPKIRSES